MTQSCFIWKCPIMQSDSTATKPPKQNYQHQYSYTLLGNNHCTFDLWIVQHVYLICRPVFHLGQYLKSNLSTWCMLHLALAHNYLHAYFIDTWWRCIHYWPDSYNLACLDQKRVYKVGTSLWDVKMKGLCASWRKKKRERLTVGSCHAADEEDSLGLKMHRIKWVSFVSFLSLMLMLIFPQ